MDRIVLSLLVDNTSGVLSRVAGLFSRRGYNIESLTVGVTADERYSRMTVVAFGDQNILEQIEKQLRKLEDVRDIKELKLIKVTDENGVSRYCPMLEHSISLPGKLLSVFSHAFVSADYANNIVVVRTLAGMAQAVAAAIDSLKLEEVLGSIAGDDTILIVCRTEKYAEEIVRMLVGLVK